MLQTIESAVVSRLREQNVPAEIMYPAEALNRSRSLVAVAVKSAVISAAGLGDYIGIAEEDGAIRELYGKKAEMKLAIRAYAPQSGSLALLETALDALRHGSVKVHGCEVSGEYYDKQSGMFCCEALADVSALIVQERCGDALGDPMLGGEDA